MEKRDDDKGEVKVTDHRRFDEEGHERPDVPPHEEARPVEPPREERAAEAGRPEGAPGRMPPMDFATFVLSLATSAQMHMGLLQNPATGKQERNLDMAKQTIDLIGMLQDKTKGNLSDQESKLIEQVLYELRMVYVELQKQEPNGQEGPK
jgi:hypothetical protein